MLKVINSFSVGKRTLRRGQVVADDDPAVAGRKHLFVDLKDEDARAQARVEQATAAPGERRNVFLEAKEAVAKAKKKAAEAEAAQAPADDVFVCDVCGKEAKNAGGLASHKRAKHE